MMKVFSAREAVKQKQNVVFITEREVLQVKNGGFELTEVVPGIDIDRDTLDKMEFRSKISEDLKETGSIIFDISARMNLLETLSSDVEVQEASR